LNQCLRKAECGHDLLPSIRTRDALAVAERIRGAIAGSALTVGEQHMPISASFGIATLVQSGGRFEEMLFPG
jgi:PleD family two-component response regulator